MKRTALIFLLLAAMTAMVFAGGGQSARTELTYMYWDDLIREDLQVVVAEFERDNPGITVDLALTPFAQYWTRLSTTLATAAAPDVFWLNHTNSVMYMPSGQLMNLDVWATDIRFENFDERFTRFFSFEGRHYAVPFMWDVVVLFYNEAIFERAGMERPNDTWTWDTFFDAARRLTIRSGGTTTQYGLLVDGASWQTGPSSFVLQNNGNMLSPDRMSGVSNSPENRYAFQQVLDMINGGYAPQQQVINEAGAFQLFASGVVAMMPGVSIRIGILADGLGQDLRVAPLPYRERRGSHMHNLGTAAATSGTNHEASRRFLSFLASRRTAEIISRTWAPCYTGMSGLFLERFAWAGASYIPNAISYSVPGHTIAARNSGAVSTMWNEGISRIFSNPTVDIGTQLADLDARITAEINR